MFSELLGDVALNEAELQARAQDVVEREWPQWRRERALRLGGESLAALNDFFAALALEVDTARAHHEALRSAQAAAQAAEVVADDAPVSDLEPVVDAG